MKELILRVKYVGKSLSGLDLEDSRMFRKNDAVLYFNNFRKEKGFENNKDFILACEDVEVDLLELETDINEVITRGKIDIANNVEYILKLIEYQKTFYPIDYDIVQTLLNNGYGWKSCLEIMEGQDYYLLNENEIDSYCTDYLYANFEMEEELLRYIDLDEVWEDMQEKQNIIELANSYNTIMYLDVFVEK